MSRRQLVFWPERNSVLDVQSLETLGMLSSEAWQMAGVVWGQFIAPDLELVQRGPCDAIRRSQGMILSGMRLQGAPSPEGQWSDGPPGKVKVVPSPPSEHRTAPSSSARAADYLEARERRTSPSFRQDMLALVVQAGMAVVELEETPGRFALVRLEQDTPFERPYSEIPGDAVLVLRVKSKTVDPGRIAVAYRALEPQLAIVSGEEADANGYLQVARRILHHPDWWETDLQCIWHPDDWRNRHLVDELRQIDTKLWQAQPQGLAWSRGVMGRDWLRYQAAASASLQSAILLLETQPKATWERVRVLESLYCRLADFREASQKLGLLLGPKEAAGPYHRLYTRFIGGG